MAIKKDIIVIELRQDGSGQVVAELKPIATVADDIEDSSKKAAGGLGYLKTTIAGLAAGVLTSAVTGAAAFAGQLKSTADLLKLNTEQLQIYRYSASQTEVTQEKLEMGLQRLVRRAGDAARNVGESRKVFDELGVSVTGVDGRLRNANDIIQDTAIAIGKMDDEGAQLSATVQLVDSEGAGLVRTFRAMASGSRNFEAEARSLGLVLDKELIARAAEADAKVDALSQVVDLNLKNALLQVAPVVDFVARGLLGLARAANDALTTDLFERWEEGLGKLQDLEDKAESLRSAAEGKGSWWENLLNFDQERAKSELRTTETKIKNQRLLVLELSKLIEEQNAPRINAGGRGLPPVAGPLAVGKAGAGNTRQKEAAAELKAFKAELQGLIDTLDPASAKTRELEQARATLARGLRTGFIENEARYSALLKTLNTDTDALREAEEKLNSQRLRALSLSRIGDPEFALREKVLEIEMLIDQFPDQAASLERYKAKIYKDFDDIKNKGKDSADDVKDAWKDLGLTFSSAFEDAIVSSDSLRDVLSGLEQDILRIVTRQFVTKPLANGLTDFLSSNGGDIFGTLFGAANGADFVVPGPGGIDTKLLPVSPGERVSVTPPGQAGGGQVVVHNHFTIGGGMSRDETNYTAKQIGAETYRAAQQAARRNG